MIIMNTNYIILYKFHTKFIQIQNFPSFFVILITNHCSLTFFSPPASPEAIADKNQRSRISSFATHPYSWNRERSRVLSQFEHGLVRATNQFPHADILERCIEKLVHTVRARCVQALAPFHSFTSRIRLPASFRVEAGRILASIRSPRLCPLCQRRRRNYFAATVDGNATVWVRRRSREAALACLPRISYFLSSIRLLAHGTRFQEEEVGRLLPFRDDRRLNWTGEFFLEMKLSREEMTIVVFVPGLESEKRLVYSKLGMDVVVLGSKDRWRRLVIWILTRYDFLFRLI